MVSLAYSNYTYVSKLTCYAHNDLLMSESCTLYSTINGFNKLYNDTDTSRGEHCEHAPGEAAVITSRWNKTKSSAASCEENLCLYIPCRTECVWSCLSHRLGSRGVYGRWLTVCQEGELMTVHGALTLPKVHVPPLFRFTLSCIPNCSEVSTMAVCAPAPDGAERFAHTQETLWLRHCMLDYGLCTWLWLRNEIKTWHEAEKREHLSTDVHIGCLLS